MNRADVTCSTCDTLFENVPVQDDEDGRYMAVPEHDCTPPRPTREDRARGRKSKIRSLQRQISGLQAQLTGKRPPHGERVADANGYYIRTKWPSNFNRAEHELQRKFRQLTDAKREVSELSRIA